MKAPIGKPSEKERSWRRLGWLPLLGLAFVVQAFWGLKNQTPTIDEFRHLPSGLYEIRTHDFSFDTKTPPLWKMLSAAPAHFMTASLNLDPVWRLPRGGWEPWIFGTRFMLDNAAHYDEIFYRAHVLTVGAALLLIALVFVWSKELYGYWPAIVTMGIMAFSPTLLANARLATPDVGVTLWMTLTAYLLRRFCLRPSWTSLLGTGAGLGLALVTKFTAVLMLPMIPLVLLLHAPTGTVPFFRRFHRWGSAWLVTGVIWAVAGGLINAQYCFQGTGARLADYSFESRLFRNLQKSFLKSCPIPLPRPYLEGFDAQKADAGTGEFPSFLNGQWSPRGWKQYYGMAFLYKEPLAFLILLTMGAIVRWGKRLPFRPAWEKSGFWFVPVMVWIVLSFFNHLDVGIRYLLPAYPFLWIFCAGTARVLLEGRSLGRGVLVFLLLGTASAPFSAAPHYQAYFNEIAGGPSGGYRHLIDSNLDHGQDLRNLKIYMDQNGIDQVQLAYFGHVWPQMYGIRYVPLGEEPKPGVVAISASFLQGQPYLLTYLSPPVPVPFDHFRALRSLRPDAQIGYSIFIYNIPASVR